MAGSLQGKGFSKSLAQDLASALGDQIGISPGVKSCSLRLTESAHRLGSLGDEFLPQPTVEIGCLPTSSADPKTLNASVLLISLMQLSDPPKLLMASLEVLKLLALLTFNTVPSCCGDLPSPTIKFYLLLLLSL